MALKVTTLQLKGNIEACERLAVLVLPSSALAWIIYFSLGHQGSLSFTVHFLLPYFFLRTGSRLTLPAALHSLFRSDIPHRQKTCSNIVYAVDRFASRVLLPVSEDGEVAGGADESRISCGAKNQPGSYFFPHVDLISPPPPPCRPFLRKESKNGCALSRPRTFSQPSLSRTCILDVGRPQDVGAAGGPQKPHLLALCPRAQRRGGLIVKLTLRSQHRSCNIQSSLSITNTY